MPRVKIDYVVSFSSEDPEHPASNLLAWEVSKKKWLCQKGESSCSIVLQLTKAVKISSVHIGAYHSALVEVLVARSEKASDQFQVLVPSCVFVPPGESRRDAPVERVRSFGAEQLAADARAQRWDRVRVVCSQPYNKHCKYGLSFVHIEGEGPASAGPAAPRPAGLALALDAPSSDEDDFRPGELFAKHLQQNTDSQSSTTSDTGAQIRQATSQALKNIPESSTKLLKTPISKPSNKRDNNQTLEDKVDRSRDTLLYTDDDGQPHARIDRAVQRHKDQREKEDKAKPQTKPDRKEKERLNESAHKPKEDKRTPKRRKSELSDSETPASKKTNKNSDDATTSTQKNRTDERRKRPQSIEEMEQDEEPPEPHTILKGVVLVLSGYENPQRAHVRNTALALGARVERDWGPACTHLICAFPRTPKLVAVRARARDAPAARADWVLQCAARRERLPWRWFATEPERRVPEPARPDPKPERRVPEPTRPDPKPERRMPEPERSCPNDDSDTECDTDDEIQKVLQKQKAKLAEPPSPSQSSTDEDEAEAEAGAAPRLGGALPGFLEGHTFAIDEAERDARLMARYVTAYGGLAVQLSELSDSPADYVVSSRARGAVPPAWLARCVRARRLLPRH